MLTHPALEQMAALSLTGLADAWQALADQDPGQALDRDEWLGLMLDREVPTRADKRFANRLRNAKMRFPDACIEDVKFAASRGLDRRQVLALAQGEWIKAKEQNILTGQTGTGKTWLACAFGHQAARLVHSVLYVRMPRLFEDRAIARLDGRFPKLVDTERRRARIKKRRDDWFIHRLPAVSAKPDHVVFIDEASVKTNQTQMRGWSQRGERLVMDAPFGGRGTQTFIAGRSADDLIASSTKPTAST